MSEIQWFFIREGFKFYVSEKLTEGIMDGICQFSRHENINPVIITLVNDGLSLHNEAIKKSFELKYKTRIYLKVLGMSDYKSKRIK